jgi:hypothetical protein
MGEQRMSRLSLIRFGTYAILIFAAVAAVRQRYVIPVHLGFGEWEAPSIRVALDGRPGFGDTVLAGSAVLRLAEERIQKDGIPIQELDVPKVGLEVQGTRLQWRVTREMKRSLGDGTIWVIVFVDDKSGETRLERYKHPEP